MWFFVSRLKFHTAIDTDGVIAYVPCKEGWSGITGLETPMGSLNMTFSGQVKHGTISSIWLEACLELPGLEGSCTLQYTGMETSQAYQFRGCLNAH